jgi:hypothetical protein
MLSRIIEHEVAFERRIDKGTRLTAQGTRRKKGPQRVRSDSDSFAAATEKRVQLTVSGDVYIVEEESF